MTYIISGLPRSDFDDYFAMDTAQLAELGMFRVRADADKGYPCRISLEDARAGESLLLLNYVSHDVANPYRTAYAIYVREAAREAEQWVDTVPPVFGGRTLSLRGFGGEGMLRGARLAEPGAADREIRAMFEDPSVVSIHAHNAAYGCFAARIERYGEM